MIKQNSLTLGSLFDGIGGFPYAASFYGIKPLWASEILSTAVSVTRRHFPDMEHVGDITQLDGAALPPVDIITFGSPCQGLSMAGRRLGLADERSGLFSEAIRIIREMQEATNGEYPKIALWENVPGALSTAGGRDFRAVLEAFTASKVPMPESGKWANAGMVRGRGVDLAWCVYNAQYFGVAQRRRRIFLVADFTGRRAGEILFVPKSLRGYFEAGGTPRQAASSYAESRAGAADGGRGVGFDGYNGSLTGARAATLGANCGVSTGRNGVMQNCLNGWDTQQSRVYTEDGQAPTLAGADGGGGRNPAGLVAAFIGGAAPSAGGIGYSETVAPTLRGASGSSMMPCVCEPELARTLTARGDSSPCADRGQNIVAYGAEQVLCAATGQANAEVLEDKSATIVAGHAQPYIAHPKADGGEQSGEAYGFDLQQITSKQNRSTLRQVQPSLRKTSNPHVVGVHQNQAGDVSVSGAAYALSTNGNATSRNAPLVAHPKVSGTLCGSGAGLSRTAGMASETDLCVVQEAIPIHDRATRCNGGGDTRNNDGSGNGLGVGKSGDPAPTITAGDRHSISYCLQGSKSRRGVDSDVRGGVFENTSYPLVASDNHAVAAVDCRNLKETGDLSGTLQAKTTPGYSLNYQNPVRVLYIVRRLTPTECERLQGYPDGWTEYGHDDKPVSDTRRYQMLGNSIAVPCAAYIMQGIVIALQTQNLTGG